MNKSCILENKKSRSADRFYDGHNIQFRSSRNRDKEGSHVKIGDYSFQGKWIAGVNLNNTIFTEYNSSVYLNEISGQRFKYNSGRLTEIIVSSSGGCMPYHELSDVPALVVFMPAAENITITVASANSDQPTLEMCSISGTGEGDIRFNKYINRSVSFSKITGVARIIGLVALISYMIGILFTWVHANLDGNVYFLAGEPTSFIKYSEWVLGLVGIFVGADYLRKEIK
jgi:hypothetical protein